MKTHTVSQKPFEGNVITVKVSKTVKVKSLTTNMSKTSLVKLNAIRSNDSGRRSILYAKML